MIWFLRNLFNTRPVIEPPAIEPLLGISAEGDRQISRLIDVEERNERMHAITIARRKLATQNLRFLSHLAKHLGVYHRAANFLAGHPEHTAAQVKSALIDAIVSDSNYGAALVDDADDDYQFPIQRF